MSEPATTTTREPEAGGPLVQAWRRWRQRRAASAFLRRWARLPPHRQLVTFIALLDRHPELRKAMRAALRAR
jgi:hypothetical protein